ncbi:MAG: 16S rRNA (cytosine(967)-C(5))-methyltransferase RsmB [Gemmatimonadota bacterium]
MSGPTESRAAALAVLRDTRRGILADIAFDNAARDLDQRGRAWTQELVYGTLRLRGRLDHVLAALSARPLGRIDDDILDVLRLGAYQLLEMDSVPAYAAVSQSVELARRTARSAAGFVNGVLQSLRRAPAAVTFPSFEADPVAHLSTWGSHPRWLVERWLTRYGAEAARRLVTSNNERPQLYLRALGQPRAVQALLLSQGIEVEPVSFAPGALRVLNGSAAAALAAAPVIVQDPAAGLVVTYAGTTTGSVIDLASAPGGKALSLAAGVGAVEGRDGRPFVVAADRSRRRLARVTDSAARLQRSAPEGLGQLGIAAVAADARTPPFRAADMVLLDAPCTGTGTLRRHPDGRWRLAPEDIASLAALQSELLDSAAGLVRPGGVLVYATCSIEPEENELQVAAFLERHGEFDMDQQAQVPGGQLEPGLLDTDGTLRVLPHEHGVDGAFAARLRRRAVA